VTRGQQRSPQASTVAERDLTVYVPDAPPQLNPRAAAALLRLLLNAKASEHVHTPNGQQEKESSQQT
jgi:hypothetical protein